MPATFNEFYLQWRNRVRCYCRRSLLEAAIHVLDEASREGHAGLGRLPWLSLLAIKWICQDRMLHQSLGKSIALNEYITLINQIWEAMDGFQHDQPIELQMRRLLRPQVGFQRRAGKGFIREAALFDSLEPGHNLVKLFREKTGLDPKAVMDLSFCLHGVVMAKRQEVGLPFFEPIYSLYPPEAIRCFFNLISRDFQQLYEFCRQLPDAAEKRLSEAFEFPTLIRYPFIRTGDAIRCLHPMLFYRAMEGLIHSVLSEAGQLYMDRFSQVFEAHVIAEGKSLGAPSYGDDEMRGWLGNESQVPDLLLAYPDCNVFLESKAGMFDESVMTIGSSAMVASKLRAVRKAMQQGWVAAAGVRKSASTPTSIQDAATNFLLIVTNKDLGTSSGVSLAKMARPGEFDPADSRGLSILPREHIYILSIDDYERLCHAVRSGAIELPAFLSACVADDSHPSTMKLFFSGHFDSHKIPVGYSKTVERAYEAVSERLRVQFD